MLTSSLTAELVRDLAVLDRHLLDLSIMLPVMTSLQGGHYKMDTLLGARGCRLH